MIRRACLVALGLALTRCAQPVVVSTPPNYVPKTAHAIAVYPFLVRSEKTPEHSVALGTQLAERLAQTQQYAVFGPAEFQIRNPDGDAVLVLTDLATAVPMAGVPIDGLVVLRGWIERRAQSTARPDGEAAGSEHVISFAHLELVEAASGQAIADAEESKPGEVNAEQALDRLTARLLPVLSTQAPGELITRRGWWDVAKVELGGLRISLPSGQALAAGLHDGDLVTSINATPATVLSVARVLRLAADGDHVPVNVHRAEGDVALELPVTH